MTRVLFSPIGGTDPISNCRDGAMLHICRVYKPDIVYLHMSKEMLEFQRQNDRYRYCIKKLGEKLEHSFKVVVIEREDLEEVQIFDSFIDEYQEILQDILMKHKGCELYLNVSSGTPAMKSSLQILGVLSEGRMKTIQVSTPVRKINPHLESHDDYDVELYWECNDDNSEELFKNRCQESQKNNLLDEIKRQSIIRYIEAYDYSAALSEAKTLVEPLPIMAQKYLRAAHHRTQLNFIGIDNELGKEKKKILPVSDEKVCNIFEHILNLQIKVQKEEYVDFIRGITPVLVDLFQIALKESGGLNYRQYVKINKQGVEKWDINKLETNPRLLQVFRNNFGLNFKSTPVYSSNLLPCIEEYSNNEELINLSKRLREFEENVRNMAAHKIVSVTREWIKQYSNGYTPEKILSMLKEYVQLLNMGIKENYWDSYNAMNQVIIDLIKWR